MVDGYIFRFFFFTPMVTQYVGYIYVLEVLKGLMNIGRCDLTSVLLAKNYVGFNSARFIPHVFF